MDESDLHGKSGDSSVLEHQVLEWGRGRGKYMIEEMERRGKEVKKGLEKLGGKGERGGGKVNKEEE